MPKRGALEGERSMLSRFARLAAYIGHARARHLLVSCGLIIGLTLAATMSWFVVALRQQVVVDAARELRNDALMLAEAEDRLLQSVDVVQLSLIEHMREVGIDSPESFEQSMASHEVHQNLKDRIAGLSYIAALSLSDRHGGLLNHSRAWPPPPVNDADRDFIRELTVDGAPQSFISAPSRSRTTGQWAIYFSRRFEATDGRLIGLVVSTIQMAYFEQFYSRLPLTGGGSFTLYRSDGMLMARYPHIDPQIGKTFAATPNFGHLVASLNNGVVQQVSLLDGKARLIAPHAMPSFPLIISVTDTMESILRPWNEVTRMFAFTTVLLELVIGATLLLSVRHLRSYEKLQAAEAELAVAQERERSARVLQTQWAHFDTALSNMRQGLCMYDRSNRILVVNRRFAEIFGLSRDAIVPGTDYKELTGLVLAAGRATTDDMNEIREWRKELVTRHERATHDWELASGQSITVTHQPMQDGWLTTYDDITERRQAEARMAHMAHHDALTSLPNRVLFRERLEAALSYAGRGGMLALLCLDLDQFKTVNDTLGHPVGDSLLQAVALRLAGQVSDTDTVARLGGDEFAIAHTGITKPTEVTAFAARLIELLDAPFEVAGHQIVIGTSIGIAFAPHDGVDADQLLRCADLALYRAKSDGRGIYRLFHAGMDAQMQARLLIELDLRQAARFGQLELFYQPLVNLRDQAVAGFEALLRWRHPQHGMIPPSEFIPLAEEIGLIASIGEWVLHRACADAVSWPGKLKIAVNISSVQFRSSNLVDTVATALSASALPPSRLELEITETVMLEDTDSTLRTLRELRALGVRIAMDDFGTGYCSLSYLRRFPFDRIKIDQSFVRELGKRRDCDAIVRAVVGLSSELGMATTAEGVETQEQLDALAVIGCTDVQGYLFSSAVPGSHVPELLCRIATMIDTLCGHEDVAAVSLARG
jgi:diguanylate cyclase (GGDEF)-like protein/PAS domain S-box-containing protein